MNRVDGRAAHEPRKVRIELDVQRFPEGSVLYHCGGTSVLLSASVQEGTPSWLTEIGRGWLTAEYAMHPRANPDRKARDGRNRGVDGRSTEIQRLVSRALRAAVNLDALTGKTITIDCDVLNADGGTRTAAINGAFVALVDALSSPPVTESLGPLRLTEIVTSSVAAVSAVAHWMASAASGSPSHCPRLVASSTEANGSCVSDFARISADTILPGTSTGRRCRPRPPAT